MTLDEVRAGLIRITGEDFGPRDMYWSSRYRSESRQVPAYRHGRVFLAGDAAHTHSPAGAQGMNTGLQDALNLGWKLGAAIAGWAPGHLLDSYHEERHPVGVAVLALTGRQFRLNTARTARRKALRWIAHRVVARLPQAQTWLARNYSGVAIRYPPQGAPAHRLAGARLPRGLVTRPDGPALRVAEFFHDGRFVLLEGAPGVAAGSDDTDLPRQVKVVPYTGCEPARLPPAMLVRPDGYVAWATDEHSRGARAKAVRQAVRHWCEPSR